MTKANLKFASMWKKSREDAGKTQEYVAQKMGLSIKTVRNWEAGVSCPDQAQGFEWFRCLGLQPLPYYMELLYPEITDVEKDDEAVDEALISLIKDYTPSEKRKLLYCLSGTHGSSPRSILELVVAYLHMPMRDRVSIANQVLHNNYVAENVGDLRDTDSVKVDTELLQKSIRRATHAVINGEDNYTPIFEEEEEEEDE